jgi:hypothetical protein
MNAAALPAAICDIGMDLRREGIACRATVVLLASVAEGRYFHTSKIARLQRF